MTITTWGQRHVVIPSSAKSKAFDANLTPWVIAPLDSLQSYRVRKVTFVKPVQSGGSTIGEVWLCYLIANAGGGDIQFNWQTDEKALDRWSKRVERILKSTKPVMDRWPTGRFDAQKGLVLFPHLNLTCQGVFSQSNVASDSVKWQINEEVHDEEGWLAGRLEQAFGRTTAYRDHKILNISNAGDMGGELHKCYLDGTQQRWEVTCPSCGQRHVMRTRWDDKRPELGGLRYDADGCRMESGYDYNKLAPTIRYQFPCGATIPDEPGIRRRLSVSGGYGEPENKGADGSHLSFTLEAVSVDYIPWLSLIRQKHDALRAMRYGDPEPWRKYLRERECIFAGEEDRPIVNEITLSARKKDRSGLEGRAVRFGALDRQQGEISKGELPHWWGVIRDFDAQGNSLLVWEGKLLTDEDAADVMKRHDVPPPCVVVDSGDDTTHVYRFCLQHGFSAIKGSGEAMFSHADGGRRIYSPPKPLALMLNQNLTRQNPEEEPLFWHYSKSGIRDRLYWLRGGGAVKWEVPSDVSEDYKAHMESEGLEERRDRNGVASKVWVQYRLRNDLFVCECYLAMLADMASLIGSGVVTT